MKRDRSRLFVFFATLTMIGLTVFLAWLTSLQP